MLPLVETPARRLRMVAPFFDDTASLVVHLADHFRAERFDVITDPAVTSLSPVGIANIRNRGGRVVATEDSRPLHAKLLHAEGNGWMISIQGSANLTNRAWHGTNAELVVLRSGPTAASVGELIDELALSPLTQEHEDILAIRTADRANRAVDAGEDLLPASLGICTASWFDEQSVTITTLEGVAATEADVIAKSATAITVALVRIDPWTSRATVPVGFDRTGTVAVRLRKSEATGSWVIVHDRNELAEWARGVSPDERRLMSLLFANPDDESLAMRYMELCRRVLAERAKRADVAEEADDPSAVQHETRWTFVREEDFVSREDQSSKRSARGNAGDPARLLRRVLFGSDPGDADDGQTSGDTSAGSAEDPLDAPAYGVPLERERRMHFAELVERSRADYLERLSHHSRHSAEHLLEDLQLLMVGAHRGVRIGALSAFDFLLVVVPTLREFVGGEHAPFVAALRRDPSLLQDRRWRAWSATTVSLLIYNACLAHLEMVGVDDPIDVSVPDVAPVLWMHNIARAMNLEPDATSFDVAMRQLPRLRWLGLWLGDVWPYPAKRLPFERFFQRMVADSHSIEYVSRMLPKPMPRLSVHSHTDDMYVVGVGRDGQVAIGFQETGSAVAYLRDGAFQREASPAPPWEKLLRTAQGCPLDRLLDDEVSEEMFEGLDVLRRLT